MDIANLELIYNQDYAYSLPRSVLERFLSGQAFDHPHRYTDEERKRLDEDIQQIYEKVLADRPNLEKIAVLTAGAPGAGKTVLLRQDRDTQCLKGDHYAYVCPDDVCLRHLESTFGAELASGSARLAAYNKWRPGSNAAAHLILAHLIRQGYAFYFGTTSSGPDTGKFYQFLKSQGYTIRVLHLTAPDEVRWESVKKRDQTWVQTTAEDVKEKARLLPQRICDTFLAHADEIEFYYRGAVAEAACRAAVWRRHGSSSTLEVLEPQAYHQIKRIHNQAAQLLARPELSWESTVEQSRG